MARASTVKYAAGLGLAAVVLGLGAAVWFAFSPANGPDDRFADCRAARVAGGSMTIGGPFEMTKAGTGERVTEADVIDRPTLLYFGYTFCPDVCPFDTADMAMATDILAERGIDVKPVFVTIDPARDTVEALGDYAEAVHPKMVGLTGSAEDVERMAQAWKVYYAKAGEDPETYLMDHSTFTYLAAPGEGFLEVYRRDATPEQMADSVQCFAEKL